ncbi:unnamed protein product [Acanthoscelides obtectus]|uniref:Uncharacterized protein n=1 Tax=Acanthoscelides obtectus TaxID=200917 RepID=A0A9P0PGR4_ACAOB|nr:unnamed protein product [Acanthoscelides obtectus]CAK1662956.1 hypothetical protein AOBTE_LOCUS23396 [Acanthoscelides obtectus]
MRNLEAIAKGLELMSEYTKLVRQYEEPGPKQVLSISMFIYWENERKSFWNVSDRNVHIKYTERSRIMLHDTSKVFDPHDPIDASIKLQNVEKMLAKLIGNQNKSPVIELIPRKDYASSASASEPPSVSN